MFDLGNSRASHFVPIMTVFAFSFLRLFGFQYQGNIFAMSFVMLLLADEMKNKAMKGIVVFTFMILTSFSDWGVLGSFMVWLFHIYREDRKRQLISYFSLCMAQMMVAVLVISSGTVAWYDGIWQIGMLLPIILIYFYNGESGKKNIVNKWSFYLFYPIQFLVFWLILKA